MDGAEDGTEVHLRRLDCIPHQGCHGRGYEFSRAFGLTQEFAHDIGDPNREVFFECRSDGYGFAIIWPKIEPTMVSMQ